MNLKYVKINGGGKVSMKGETEGSMYTKEEQILSDEVCDLVNADKELKHFFATTCFKILREFAGDITKAFNAKDKEEGKRVMQNNVDLIKALAMHVYIKVMMKKKEVK